MRGLLRFLVDFITDATVDIVRLSASSSLGNTLHVDARLDGASNHIFRSTTARESDNKIRLADVQHLLISHGTSGYAMFVPVRREGQHFAKLSQAGIDRPRGSEAISTPRCAVDQHRDRTLGSIDKP